MKGNLLKDFFSYGTVGVLGKFVGFVTIPIYTRFLSQADFGVLEIISVAMVLLAFLSTFQLESSFLRLYFEKKNKPEQRALFSNGLWIIIPGSILVALLIAAFSNSLSSLALKTSQYSYLIILAACELVFKNVLEYSIIVFRVEFNRKGYTTFNLTYVACNALAGIVAVAVLNYGLAGLLVSRCVVSMLFATIALYKAKKYITYQFSMPVLKEMLQFGVPLIPVVIAQWGQKYLSRILIILLFSLAQIGLYAVVTKVLLPFLLLTHSLRMAWHPYSYSNFDQTDSKALFNDFFNIFSFATTIVALVVIFFGGELLVLVASDKFIAGQNLLGLLAIAYMLNGLTDLVSTGILIKKKNTILSYAAIASTTVGCIAMYYFSLKLGLIGIVIGELIGEMLKFIITSLYVGKLFNGYFKFSRTVCSITLILTLAIILNQSFVNIELPFSGKTILFLLFSGLFATIYLFKNTSLYQRIKSLHTVSTLVQALKKP